MAPVPGLQPWNVLVCEAQLRKLRFNATGSIHAGMMPELPGHLHYKAGAL